ncbi:MAG: ATP-dependent Clp protease proteolytic subunit [Planctomycetes bacterium]|nr:ATP-dependent Clp protease proteolytic subunit [Planctomycetota bacterium]
MIGIRVVVLCVLLLPPLASAVGIAPPTDKPAPSAKFALIPLHGHVGLSQHDQCFSAKGVLTCLEEAKARGADAVVFHINSPGGRVDSKQRIQQAISLIRRERVRTIAVIEDAGSAAALIALACDEWYALPGCKLGAATTVLTSDDGSAMSFNKAMELDPDLKAKYKSWQCAQDLEACRDTGRPTILAMAMKDKEHEVWYSASAGFTAKASDSGSELIDSKEEILTLTYTQLVQYGLARSADSLQHALDQIGGYNKSLHSRMEDLIDDDSDRLAKEFKAANRCRLDLAKATPKTSSKHPGADRPSRDSNDEVEGIRTADRNNKLKQLAKTYERIVELLNAP